MKASERILVVASRPEWQWKRYGYQDGDKIGQEFGVHPRK
jgi:hypothetical protein